MNVTLEEVRRLIAHMYLLASRVGGEEACMRSLRLIGDAVYPPALRDIGYTKYRAGDVETSVVRWTDDVDRDIRLCFDGRRWVLWIDEDPAQPGRVFDSPDRLISANPSIKADLYKVMRFVQPKH